MNEEQVFSEISVIDNGSVTEYQDRAQVDIQIATAKKYPRDVKRSRDNAIAIVTMDKDTASSCGYSLPRGGKSVSGPSVHLANILAQTWGNMRVEAKVIGADKTHVTSQATCFDLENNLAVRIEVKRRITDKYGKRFNDDMITVTGNAANSIAKRNAILSVIPKSVVESTYNAAQQMITGDISDENKLISKRKNVFEGYQNTHGLNENQVLSLIGLRSINQVKKDELVQLIGIAQAIKDGDTTVEELLVGIQPSSEKKAESVVDAAKKAVEAKQPAKKEPEKPKTKKEKEPEQDNDSLSGGLYDMVDKLDPLNQDGSREMNAAGRELFMQIVQAGINREKIQKVIEKMGIEFSGTEDLILRGSKSTIKTVISECS